MISVNLAKMCKNTGMVLKVAKITVEIKMLDRKGTFYLHQTR